MFTPMKVAKGPVNALAVGDWRVTVGEFVSGGSFCKVEEWKTMQEPHEQMPRPWKGTTYFVSSAGACKGAKGEVDNEGSVGRSGARLSKLQQIQFESVHAHTHLV